MKTKIFVAICVIVGLILSYWRILFIIPTIFIILFGIMGEYHSRPGKKSYLKSKEILEEFLEHVPDLSDSNRIKEELKNYTVRKLCYLYDGLEKEIWHLRSSDFTMSYKEEMMQDNMRRTYEKALHIVKEHIPEKYHYRKD